MEQNKLTSNGRPPVMFLPGAINPAAVTYGPLLEVLKDEIRPLLKDLEVYAADTLPPEYSLEWEIEGIKRAAEAAEMMSFHLIEYFGGPSLAFTPRYPEWVRSLALIEPGWIADDKWRREEAVYWSEVGRVSQRPHASPTRLSRSSPWSGRWRNSQYGGAARGNRSPTARACSAQAFLPANGEYTRTQRPFQGLTHAQIGGKREGGNHLRQADPRVVWLLVLHARSSQAGASPTHMVRRSHRCAARV
jgi:hypothetical protein